MDSILPLFYIILVVILIIWGILFLWRTVMVLRLMDSFSPFPSQVELIPLPASEIPEAVNEALDKISVRGWHPQPIHGQPDVFLSAGFLKKGRNHDFGNLLFRFQFSTGIYFSYAASRCFSWDRLLYLTPHSPGLRIYSNKKTKQIIRPYHCRIILLRFRPG